MSFKVNIKLSGGITNLTDNVKKGLEIGIAKSVAKVTQAAMTKVPVKTGNLRRSIQAKPIESLTGKFSGKVVQDEEVAKYGPFVEFGTGLYGPKKQKIAIRPDKKKALFWKGAEHPVKLVMNPGMKARPYMRPALEENVENIKQIIQTEVNKAIKGG